jgi:hypothetical protein
MISLKELKDDILTLSAKGALTAADNLDAQPITLDGFITAVLVQCGVVGVDGTGSPTQDVRIDIKQNGTSIVGATKITFTHTALAVTPNSYGTLVGLAPIAVSKGDVLSLQCTQILNGTSPTQPLNLCASLRIQRARGGGIPSAIITGALES